MPRTSRRERRYQNRSVRCKICRCKPCKCKEEIHCYQIRPTRTMKRKNTRKKSKGKNKRVSQKGGFLPIAVAALGGCTPCLAGPALGVAGLGTAGYMVTRKSKESVNGKTEYKRKESYSLSKNGKNEKKVFSQKNNRIYVNKREILPRSNSLKAATKKLNKKIKSCVKSGFKKC
jgi:uncharacterized protein HemX